MAAKATTPCSSNKKQQASGRALELGVDLSEDPATIGAITSGITLLVGTVYYAIVRELETRISPAWGWLLGRAKAPEYTPASGELR